MEDINPQEETKPEAPKLEPRLEIDKFLKNYGTPISILVGALIIAASIYVSNGGTIKGFGLKTPAKTPSAAATPPSSPQAVAGSTVNVSADDDPFLGNANAPVTIIEFGDFQCPFCRKLWRDALPQIKAKYIDTGKAKFVYRDFPLDIHPAAEPSAQAAACANEQGKFWQYHDKIFEEQDKQGESTIRYAVEDLKKWAREVGLNVNSFNTCLDSGKYKQEVDKDLQDGIAAGVTGTPGSFINGRQIKGALPFAQFEKIIEEELKKK